MYKFDFFHVCLLFYHIEYYLSTYTGRRAAGSVTRPQEVLLGCPAPLIHVFYSLKKFSPAPPRLFSLNC